jgi:hypothetical protein
VHTAVEPRPQWGFGCLPEQGPGGQSLAAAASVPSRIVSNVRVMLVIAMTKLRQRILLDPPVPASRILRTAMKPCLGRSEQIFVWKRTVL